MKPSLKPRRMVAMTDPRFHVLNGEDSLLTMRSPHDTVPRYVPVLVIPLTKETVDALVTKATAHLHKRYRGMMTRWRIRCDADEVCRALGIKVPRKP